MTYMGGTVAALVADRNAWHTRANQAWGTSRVWNSGSSFETDLAAMTADRNAWQASSNTWQGRANQAWGPSRNWSSGESWEAAYNRVLPAGSGASPVILDVTSGFTESNANSSYKQFFAWTIPTTGYWSIHLEYSYDNGAGQSDLYTRWQGPDGSLTVDTPYVWTSRTGVLQANYTLAWGAGGIVRYQARSTNGGPYLARHGCTATFVPTPTYPH